MLDRSVSRVLVATAALVSALGGCERPLLGEGARGQEAGALEKPGLDADTASDRFVPAETDRAVALDAGSDATPLDTGSDPPPRPSVDGGGEPEAPICSRDGETPSAQLQALQETLITPGCVGAGRFCHGEGYAFNMRDAKQTLENLVNVRGCGGVRVVPCRPDQSFVSSVIRNGGQPCGRPLVVNGRHPTFSQREIDAVEDWIRAGAR
jgi:hypothetical protein